MAPSVSPCRHTTVVTLSSMRVDRGLRVGQRHGDRVGLEMGDGALDVGHQHRRQVAADALADHDPHHGDVLGLAGQREGRRLPAAARELVGEVVEGVGRVRVGLHHEADGRDAGLRVAVADELERTQLGDVLGEPAGGVVAGLVDAPIAGAAEPQEVVVPGDHLAGGARLSPIHNRDTVSIAGE